MNLHKRHSAFGMGGFSLVELMVGLVIGLVAIVLVAQVFALSEGSKRTTTSGNDAQTTGAVALMTLQRDIRQAGYGITNAAVVGCDVRILPAGWVISNLAPVIINHANIPAGDNNTDTLTIAYGGGTGSSDGDRVITQPVGVSTTFSVTTPTSFNLNDQVLAAVNPRPNVCTATMEKVTAITPSPNIQVANGTANMTDGTLFNLGQSPQVRVYAIRKGALTVCDYLAHDCSSAASAVDPDPAVWVPIADNVVSLRAQYAQDTTHPGDAVADSYDQVTPPIDSAGIACAWTRILGLRVALVSRSNQMDKQLVTFASPPWSGASAVPIVLSGNASWQNYRYRSYEATIPVRNMAWQAAQAASGVPASCP